MNDVPEEELFSAYLDGEVTAGEQAQIEQLLAVSPAARQLMDELRALSVTLQSLPSHKIGEDISGDVLRAVQYRLINDPDESPEPSVTIPMWKRALRRAAKPRNLVWPLAAAAAAILMMLNAQGPDARRDPGMALHVPKAAAPEKAPAADEKLNREDENLEIRALPEDRAASWRYAEADQSGERTHPGIAERRMDRAAPKFRENAGETEAVSSEAIDGVADKAGNRPDMPKALAPAAPAASAPVASPTPAAPPSEAAVMPRSLAATESQPDSGMKAESAGAAGPGEFQYKPGKGVDARFGVAAGVETRKAGTEPVVLHYYVTPEAVRGDVLQAVLQKHQIAVAWSERSVDLKTEEKSDAQQSADAKKVDLPSRGRPLIVEAEATPEQLEAALVELRSRPAMFVAMSDSLGVNGPADANELLRMRAAPMQLFEAKGAPPVEAVKPAEGEMSTQSAFGGGGRGSELKQEEIRQENAVLKEGSAAGRVENRNQGGDFMRGSGYGAASPRVMQGQAASQGEAASGPASRYRVNGSAEPSPAAKQEAGQAGGQAGLKPKASRAMKSITADQRPSLGRPKPVDQPAATAREPMAEQKPVEEPEQARMMQQQKLADFDQVRRFSDSLQEKQQDFAKQGLGQAGQQSQERMGDGQAAQAGRQRVQFVLHLLPENTTAGAARAATKAEGAEAVQHDAATLPAQPPAVASPPEK